MNLWCKDSIFFQNCVIFEAPLCRVGVFTAGSQNADCFLILVNGQYDFLILLKKMKLTDDKS